MVGLMSQQEYDSFNKTGVNQTDYCNETVQPYSQIYRILNFNEQKTQTFYGKIPSKDVYYLYYFGCPDKYFNFSFEIHFLNPKGGLDYRSEPLLYTSPILLFIITALLILWLINWFCNFSVQIYIHYCFTATFIFTFLNSLANFIDIQATNNDGNTTLTFILYFVTLVIKYIIMLSTILLCAKGWCIIVDRIKVCDLFLSVIYSGITTTLFILGFIFRIRDVDAGGYYAIGANGDDSAPEEFVLADIERLEHEGDEPINGGIEWKPGMALPNKPNIVKTTTITLEMPEGIEDVLVNNPETNPTVE